jgi:hypothetical protein
MRLLLPALIASLLTVTSATAQLQPAVASPPIAGRVVDAGTGAPLRRARVTVTVAGRAGEPVFTADDGRFVAGLAAAEATVTVSKAGYTTNVVTPSASQLAEPLQFVLARSAAVMGRVVEDAGSRPFSWAYVTARLISDGGRTPAGPRTRAYTQTDQLGGYRLGALAAGRYEITAIRGPLLEANGSALENQLFGPRDSLDVARVLTVTLAAGDELRDIDFTVPGSTRDCGAGLAKPGSPTGAARIQGRVTGPAGEPLVCAQVSLSSDAIPSVRTDAEGRYTFDRLPAGSYVVQAHMLPDYLSLRYGQRRPADEDRLIVLGEGERRDGVDIVLPRQAVITGTLWDEHGEPVEGVSVSAFELRRRNGRLVAATRANARATDDRGQYRIVAVPPGSYLIGATATGALATTAEPRAYVSSYHPATTEMPLARQVVVDVGGEVTGIDIVLNPVRTATVTGMVLAPDGRPFSGTVSLTTSARGGVASLGTRSAQTDAAGQFALRGVPPGDYVLKAPVQAGGSPLFGMQYVTVTEGDPPPAIVRLTEGATLEGRMTLDLAPGTNPAGLEITYASTDFDRDPSQHRSSFVREFGPDGSWDGTFRLSGIFGPSRLTAPRLPGCDTCYLKSVRVNGVDAADTPFDFGLAGGTIRDVEVVVSDAGATIEGRVIDDAAARTDLAMLVMPALEAHRYPSSPYVKFAMARSGRLEAAGLPAGEYIVVAAHRDDVAMATFDPDDPSLVALLAARGTRVTVFERERATVNLRVRRR